jgi:hypothetical protein
LTKVSNIFLLVLSEDKRMNGIYLRFRLILGAVSLIIGLLAVNLTLLGWGNPEVVSYLLGGYSRYVCGIGGFSAIIFGAMLIRDFFVLRTPIESGRNIERNVTALLMCSKTEWLLAEDWEKPCLMESRPDFFLETEEEPEVVDHK